MKKECSAAEARFKAEAYCSLTERCKEDVIGKLYQWGAPTEAIDAILCQLEKEKYVDEQRYACAFVRDKYRFNRWGRIKIAQALRLKRIPDSYISVAMEEIDEKEYQAILQSLLLQKMQSLKAKTDYERTGKLVRFAAGRGYEMDDILSCVKHIGCNSDEYMD